MAVPTPEERIGSKLAGKYKILKILGKGGMGIVYAGKHLWTDREVAIKLLRANLAQDAEIAHRFLREARTSAKIKHPHIVDVLDMGRDDDGSVYLVYELLHGEPLGDRIKRGELLEPVEAVEVLVPVMDALAAAHAAKIVHRDIKPDNIFLCDGITEGSILTEGINAKLLDFGIAKVIDAKDFQTITGTVMGTPYYMAPEQARASKDVSPAADVWSMAVVFYHAVSGLRPYAGKRPGQVMEKLIKSDPVLLSEAAPEIPAPIARCIDRVLVRDPAARPSMAELAQSLRDAAAEVEAEAAAGSEGEGGGRSSREISRGRSREIPATVQLDGSSLGLGGEDRASGAGPQSGQVVIAEDWDDSQDAWDRPTEAMERPSGLLDDDPQAEGGEEATLAVSGSVSGSGSGIGLGGGNPEDTGSSRLRAALQTVTTAEAKADDRRSSSTATPTGLSAKALEAAPVAHAPPAQQPADSAPQGAASGSNQGLVLGLVALVVFLAGALAFVLLRSG